MTIGKHGTARKTNRGQDVSGPSAACRQTASRKSRLVNMAIAFIVLFSIILFVVSLSATSINAAAAPLPSGSAPVAANANQALFVSSTDLIEKAKERDKQSVIFQGEIVGDLMRRGDHVWINVSDGVNAIGVWLEAEQAKDLLLAGRYATRGDVVKVTGTFYRACTEHGGDYDIHAQSLVKIESGYFVTHQANPWLIMISIATLLGAMFVLYLLLRQRLKRAGHLLHQAWEDRYV